MRNTDPRQKPTACRDSHRLGCWGNSKFTVGLVSEVNGPNSVEVRDFVPTHHELIQLVKYWASLKLRQSFYFFVHGQTGSDEWRRAAIANRRIERIATLLGEKEVQKAIKACEREFSRKIDPKAWAIFKNGTPKQQEAFQRNLHERFRGTPKIQNRRPPNRWQDMEVR
jgi:hypothetical protein